MATPAVDEDSFNALNVLSGELNALNDSIPKLIEAVNQLTQLLSGKTGIFKLLLKEHEGKPSAAPKKSLEELRAIVAGLSEEAQEWLVPTEQGTLVMKAYSKDREVWNRINEELKGQGFKWISRGRDSRWEGA